MSSSIFLSFDVADHHDIRSTDAGKTHAVGGVVGVDSTFAPPPLSDPFKWGADIVMRKLSLLSKGTAVC